MKFAHIAIAALSAALMPSMASAIPPTTTPVAGASVLIDHSTQLLAVNIVTGATAGYLIVVDSSTLPADGTVAPMQCMPVAVTTGIMANFRSAPVQLTRGAAVMFSTGASCFALVKSATAYISVEVR